jgi:16S rRNA (guanine966-N2)-methyltransferase
MSRQTKFRITAGSFKGRILSSPPNLKTRPMQGSLREVLFNILGPSILSARVLDLFSGTGSIGLEALSRGAASCVFCESYLPALKVLRRNIEALGVTERVTFLKMNLLARRPFPSTKFEPYGLIFLDPPFAMHDAQSHRDLAPLVERLAEQGLLEKEVTLVLQQRKGQSPPAALGPLRLEDQRFQGSVILNFFKTSKP